MIELNEQNIDCPYCGETISVLIDRQEAGGQYIEDCQVCCRPIVFQVSEDVLNNLIVTVYCEDDVV
ncbi:CPXCG motif-containing cysteine-rich protein [Psychromonas sp.]|uniref:CPXCG motif-containing cysteine-rich protein n=1 Tax=Psychromonas sp. TaxID=1884585 RepID=UPI0039E447FB